MPGGSPSQQSTAQATPERTPIFAEEENLRIKLIRLEKRIGKLKYQAHKFKVLFHYVRGLNNQLCDSNLRLFIQNDALKRNNRQLLKWKATRTHPAKRINSQKLARQFTKFSVPVKRGLEVLVKAIGL